MDIILKVQESIAESLKTDCNKVKELTPDTPMNVIGLDSLNFIDCILNLEEVFDIEFDDDELLYNNLDTLRKLSIIISRKLNDE